MASVRAERRVEWFFKRAGDGVSEETFALAGRRDDDRVGPPVGPRARCAASGGICSARLILSMTSHFVLAATPFPENRQLHRRAGTISILQETKMNMDGRTQIPSARGQPSLHPVT